jgi:predicted molibdopterin-dependent oxidoreductase YjgC
MIAAELAARLGGDLDVAGVGDLWDEIERMAPSHAGITRTVLEGPAGRDGIVAPIPSAKVGVPRLRPFDPMATPGIEAVERQGAPPRAGLAEPVGGEDQPGNGGTPPPAGGGRPPLLTAPAAVSAPSVATRDGYAVRLAAGRRLYDGGAAVEASESLAPLAGSAVARLHPSELERAGAHSGGRLKLRSGRGELVLEAHADHGLPAGVVWVPFNLEGDDEAGVSALVDATAAVTDVRLETP